MFKSLPEVAMQIARFGVIAVLLVIAVDASAQAYSPAALEPIGLATPQQFGLAASSVHAMVRDNEMEMQMIDVLGKKQPRANRFQTPGRSGPWTLYGRIGILGMQNQLGGDSAGMQFSLRGGGPGFAGKFHIGIHRRF